jgi:hypothetical protein
MQQAAATRPRKPPAPSPLVRRLERSLATLASYNARPPPVLSVSPLVAAPAAVRTAGFAVPCAFATCAASGIGAGAPRSALALVVDAPISRLFAAHGDGRLDVVCSSLSRRSVTCPLSPRCS